jgi:PAS domain S-box-containing protein
MAYIETSAHSIGDIFNEVQRDLRTVIVGPALQGLIRARDNQNRDPVSGISAVMWGDLLAERFEAMAQSYFRYSQLRYLDENGDEVVRVDYDGIQAWRVPAAELQNKADWYYFQQAMQRLPDQIYISSTDLNREAGQIQVPYQPTIRYAMPVFNKEGERRGVVVFNVMVEEVIQTDIVPPSGEGVFAFVVDSQGYYVHNVLPEKEFGGPADLNTGEGIRADFPELAHRILSGQMGEGYTTGLQIFYAPIQIAPEQGDFWVLGLAVPRVIIQAPTRQFALVFAGVLAFSLLLAISAGSLIARRISQPLEALRQGARQIAGGHFDQRVRVKGSVEITDLADDFNQMVIQLETLYSSLQTDYRYLFESANDSIFIHDLNGRILDVNENAVRRLNYTKEELLRMTLDDIDTPEAAGCTDENLRLLKERGNLVIESAHRHKDGSVIPIEVSSTLVTYLGQKVVLSFVRDIRERKRAEAEIIRLYEQLKARRIEQQAALLRLSQGLLAATERQEMMDLTVQIAAQALAVPMAALMLPEEKPDPTDMVLRAAIGGRPEQIGNFRLPIGPDSGAGYAFSTGQPIVIGDVTAERRFRPHEIAFKLGVQAGLAVPVSVSGRVIGALSVASLEPSAFDEDDLRLLSLIANQTAIALERDRLFEETRRRASELEAIAEVGSLVTAGGDLQAILDTLAHKIADSTGFDAVDIGLYVRRGKNFPSRFFLPAAR